LIQVIEGAGDEVIHVLGGLADSGAEGLRLLDARWRLTVDEPADTVIAGISGDSVQRDFAALARAVAAAARVVKSRGRIVLLSRAKPTLGPGVELLRQTEDLERALNLLRQKKPPDLAAAFQWASAAQQASLLLLSELPAETVEELFATPLEHVGQVQRLVNSGGKVLVLPDAHKTMAVYQDHGSST